MDSVTFHVEKDRELRIRVPESEPQANPAAGTGSSIRLIEEAGEEDIKRGGRGGRGGGRAGRGRTSAKAAVVEVSGALLHPEVRHFLCPGTTVVIRAWTSALIELVGSTYLREECCDVGTNGLHARPALEYHHVLNISRKHAYSMFISGGGAATINPQTVAAAMGENGGVLKAEDTGAAENGSERLARMDRYGVGPRVLVIGKECSGRHTFVRTLGNYASRLGHCPTIVDLSPSSSQCIGLPGSIGAAVQESPLTTDCGNTYDFFPSICFPVGVTEPQSPDALSYSAGGRSVYGSYNAAALELCNAIARRLSLTAVGSTGSHSGCIVCVPPLRGRDGTDFIIKLIETLAATHVMCIGDAGMHASLSKSCGMLAPFVENNVHDPTSTEEASAFVAKHRPQLILPSGYRFQLDYISTSPAVVYRSSGLRRAFGVARSRIYFGGGGRFQVSQISRKRRHEEVSVFQLAITYSHRAGSATHRGAEVIPTAPGASAMLAAHPPILTHPSGGADQPPPSADLETTANAIPYFLSQWATLASNAPPPLQEDGSRVGGRPYIAPLSWSVSGPPRVTKLSLPEIKAAVGSLVAVMDVSSSTETGGRQALSLTNLESKPIAVFGQLLGVDVEELTFLAPIPENALSELPHVALVVLKFHLS